MNFGSAIQALASSIRELSKNLLTKTLTARVKGASGHIGEIDSNGVFQTLATFSGPITIALTNVAQETGGNLDTIAGKDFATETTLGTVAKESGGNLDTIAGDTTSLDGKVTKCDTDTVTVTSQVLPTGAVTFAQMSAANALLATLATASAQTDGTQKAKRVDASGNVAPAGDDKARPVLGETERMPLAHRIDWDATGTTCYVGWADAGTATSAAGWRVKRISVSGSDVTEEWADGDGDYDNVWDNRASLSYS